MLIWVLGLENIKSNECGICNWQKWANWLRSDYWKALAETIDIQMDHQAEISQQCPV